MQTSHKKIKSKALVTLGDNIRKHREQLGYSQEKLAFEAELDRTYIGGAERGERNLTILSTLKICAALGVSLEAIVKEVDQ